MGWTNTRPIYSTLRHRHRVVLVAGQHRLDHRVLLQRRRRLAVNLADRLREVVGPNTASGFSRTTPAAPSGSDQNRLM